MELSASIQTRGVNLLFAMRNAHHLLLWLSLGSLCSMVDEDPARCRTVIMIYKWLKARPFSRLCLQETNTAQAICSIPIFLRFSWETTQCWSLTAFAVVKTAHQFIDLTTWCQLAADCLSEAACLKARDNRSRGSKKWGLPTPLCSLPQDSIKIQLQFKPIHKAKVTVKAQC